MHALDTDKARRLRPWVALGLGALLTSGVAWASLPASRAPLGDSDRQWRALGVQPLAAGGQTGLRMAAGEAVIVAAAAVTSPLCGALAR